MQAVAAIPADLRQAWRSIRTNLAFAAQIVGIVAIAVAVGTVIFGIAGVLLFAPLAVDNPERIGWLFGVDSARGNARASVSLPDFIEYRSRTTSFETLAARTGAAVTLTGHGDAARLIAFRVTANQHRVWGLDAILGRTFATGDDAPGAAPAVVISHGFWQRQFGSDRSIVGRPLRIDGVPHTVVGVLTPRVEVGVLAMVDLWVPLEVDPSRPRDRRDLQVSGLLRPGVSPAQASREIEAIGLQLEREYPATNTGWGARVLGTTAARTPAQTWYNVGLMAVGAILLLLVASANTAHLLLARVISRQKEFSIRIAVGATGTRLVRQQVFEGLMLAVPAALAGLLVALLVIAALKGYAYQPFYSRIPVGWPLGAFALMTSLITPALFGIVGVLRLHPRDEGAFAAQAAADAGGGAPGRRFQRVLMSAECAAALLLLLVSGLVLRSLLATVSVDLGLDRRNLLTFVVDLPRWKYPQPLAVDRYYAQSLQLVRQLRNVAGAAVTSAMPVLGPEDVASLSIEGHAAGRRTDLRWANRTIVSPGFFATARIRLVSGRDFTLHDNPSARRVAIVNEEFARRYARGRSLVGTRIAFNAEGDSATWHEIVGIVANTRNRYLVGMDPQVYLPHAQHPERTMIMFVRTPDATLPGEVRGLFRRLDRDVAVYEMQTFDRAFSNDHQGDYVMFGLFAGLAVVAAALAVVGLYGVMSCLVAQRRREFGVRLALGATAPEVSGIVLREGCTPLVVGILAGLTGSMFVSKAAVSAVYGISADRLDPAVYLACTVVLAASAMMGLWIPARLAMRTNASDLLRSH